MMKVRYGLNTGIKREYESNKTFGGFMKREFLESRYGRLVVSIFGYAVLFSITGWIAKTVYQWLTN